MKELKNFINTLRSEGTKARYKSNINDFCNFKKINSIEDFKNIKVDDFYEYKNYLINTKHNSENTMRPKFSAIGAFYKYLIDIKILNNNIIEESKILSKTKKIVNPEHRTFLKNDEITNFLAQCRNPRETAICTVFLNTALRTSELINLELDKYTRYVNKNGENASYIYCNRKGGKIKKIYFNPYVTEKIEEYLKVRKNGECNKLFVSNGGNQMSNVSIYRTIKKLANRANIDKQISAHSLRRTVATDMSAKGVSLREIQATLSHSSIATTAMYIQNLTDNEDLMMDYVIGV